MQSQAPQKDVSANILLEMDNVVMHRFIDKKKSFISSGILKIAKADNENNTIYFINFNSFYYILNKSVIFAKIEYQDTISYLFIHFDRGINSFTFIKNQVDIHNVEEVISNVAVLETFSQAIKNNQFKLRVEEHCEGVEKTAIYEADKIKSTIKQVGKILGATLNTIGGYVAGGVNYVGEYLDQKLEQSTQKSQVPIETKQKWQNIKKGTSNILNVSKEFYNKYVAYYVDSGIGYGKHVTAGIESSNNPTVVYARGLASATSEAIGTAFEGLTEGVSKVNTQVGVHTRNLVQKKYGQDYVKTFLSLGDETKKDETKQETKDETKDETKVESHEDEETTNVHEQGRDTKIVYPDLEEKVQEHHKQEQN